MCALPVPGYIYSCWVSFGYSTPGCATSMASLLNFQYLSLLALPYFVSLTYAYKKKNLGGQLPYPSQPGRCCSSTIFPPTLSPFNTILFYFLYIHQMDWLTNRFKRFTDGHTILSCQVITNNKEPGKIDNDIIQDVKLLKDTSGQLH